LRAALFNGDPAGPGPGNPVDRDPFGLAFRVNDPPLLIAELAYAYNQEQAVGSENPNQEGVGSRRTGRSPRRAEAPLPGTVKLGAWFHTGTFADQRLDALGGLLAASNGSPLQHRGNFAIYAMLDQMLWRVPGGGDRGLSMFLRASGAPSDRNPIDLYVDGGLTFKGPFASRPDDIVGIGLAYGASRRRLPRAIAMRPPWRAWPCRSAISKRHSSSPIRFSLRTTGQCSPICNTSFTPAEISRTHSCPRAHRQFRMRSFWAFGRF
jgi:porin